MHEYSHRRTSLVGSILGFTVGSILGCIVGGLLGASVGTAVNTSSVGRSAVVSLS